MTTGRVITRVNDVNRNKRGEWQHEKGQRTRRKEQHEWRDMLNDKNSEGMT